MAIPNAPRRLAETRYSGHAPRCVVLLALAAGIVASEGWASIGSIEQVSQTTVADSSDWKQVEAECPAGTIAFSGGASLNLTSPGQAGRLVVHQSQPIGNPPTSWLALAQERLPTGDPWRLTSWALCAKVSGYELVDTSSPFDSTSPKSVTASCPPGKVPIGGGGSVFFFSQDLALYSLLPTATGWEAKAAETSPVAGNWILEAAVSCAAPPLDIERFDLLTTNATESVDDLELSCPFGHRSLGGGAAVPEGNGIFEVVPNGPSWSAAGLRIGGGIGTFWTLGARVLCYLPSTLFADGFESGDTSRWSSVAP